MPCHAIPGVGIVCTRPRRRRCKAPGCTGWATILCDFFIPKGKGRTCDRPCCERHSRNVGPDRDLCFEHAGGDVQRRMF